KGVDPNSKDNTGRTPLSWAASHGQGAVVQLLLEKGVDPDSKDEDGRTPLSWAAYYGHEAVVKLLLEKGVDLGLDVAVVAGAVAAIRNKSDKGERRSRSRSRSRGRAFSAVRPDEDDYRSQSQRRKHMAGAGLAGTSVAAPVEYARSRSLSQKGERSNSRLRTALPVVAAGQSVTVATGFNEKKQTEGIVGGGMSTDEAVTGPPSLLVEPLKPVPFERVIRIPDRAYAGLDLEIDLSRVQRTLQSLWFFGGCDQEQLLEARPILSNWMEFIDDKIKETTSGPEIPRWPSSVPIPQYKFRKFRCRLCPAGEYRTYQTRGNLMRHLDEKHIFRFNYYCTEPHCPDAIAHKPISHRRDTVVWHFQTKHGRTPHFQEIDQSRHEEPPPRVCALCHNVVRSWNEFRTCVVEHCRLPSAAEEEVETLGSSPKRLTLEMA
ncbi:hypothetical protein VTN00DRAFT_3368, partial [Thermoascus crustaceus]|uniref:uncharacterized protein n=1 Tax=Thermoascus crustaceus TaxID=5088 RepID=UPI0037447B47